MAQSKLDRRLCRIRIFREVYFYKHNRIFYITVDGNDIYLLHACKKQKNKTEKKDSKIVKKRAKELGKELGKTFI